MYFSYNLHLRFSGRTANVSTHIFITAPLTDETIFYVMQELLLTVNFQESVAHNV
jgi:hypothetical protein